MGKKQTNKRTFFDSTEKIFFHQNLPHKNLVEKKNYLPTLYIFITHFFLQLLQNLLGPSFAHSIFFLVCELNSCLPPWGVALAICKPYPCPLLKLELKISPTV